MGEDTRGCRYITGMCSWVGAGILLECVRGWVQAYYWNVFVGGCKYITGMCSWVGAGILLECVRGWVQPCYWNVFGTPRLLAMKKTYTNKTCLLVASYLLDDIDEMSNVSQLVAYAKISRSVTRWSVAGSDAHVSSPFRHLFP